MTETPDVPPIFDGQQFQITITGEAEVIRGDSTDDTKEED